jgi:hypothetical protein
MATVLRRTSRRVSLFVVAVAPFVVAFLANARHPSDSPAPALACTGAPNVFVFPSGKDVPVNAQLRMLGTGSALEVDPTGAVYELRTGGNAVAAAARQMTESVEILPASTLAPRTTYELVWSLRGSGDPTLFPLETFETGSRVDSTPPVLRSVGAPAYHPLRGEAVTDCHPWQWMVVPISVTDDSRVVVAAWFGDDHGHVDTTRPPDIYGNPDGGTAWIVLPSGDTDDKAPDFGRYRFRKRAFALMAIDEAGNRSEIVAMPGGRRSPAAPWPPAAATQLASPASGRSDSGGPRQVDAGSAGATGATTTADASGSTEPGVSSATPQVPTERQPAGCGCALAPGL